MCDLGGPFIGGFSRQVALDGRVVVRASSLRVVDDSKRSGFPVPLVVWSAVGVVANEKRLQNRRVQLVVHAGGVEELIVEKLPFIDLELGKLVGRINKLAEGFVVFALGLDKFARSQGCGNSTDDFQDHFGHPADRFESAIEKALPEVVGEHNFEQSPDATLGNPAHDLDRDISEGMSGELFRLKELLADLVLNANELFQKVALVLVELAKLFIEGAKVIDALAEEVLFLVLPGIAVINQLPPNEVADVSQGILHDSPGFVGIEDGVVQFTIGQDGLELLAVGEESDYRSFEGNGMTTDSIVL